MLRDDQLNQEISEDTLAARKEKLAEQALQRFLDFQKEPHCAPQDSPMFSSRQNALAVDDTIAMERILGKNDLFPISYLQTGLNISKPVCRISLRDQRGSVVGYATGFLVSSDLLMTNNHVLESPGAALNSIAEFNYQNDEKFMPCPTYSFQLDPEKFFLTDENLDFTLVSVKNNLSREVNLNDFGYLPLLPQDSNILEEEYVSIIQHPKGGPKAVTLRENKVSSIKNQFIHYLTDTEPGSSGSPVFNDQWILVALHHAGVPHPDNKNEWIANEGIRIASIIQYITAQYPSLTAAEQKLIQAILPDITSADPDDKVDNRQYSDEMGYNKFFLGKNYEVPLPALSEDMAEDTAKLKDGSYVLDYTHFSLVMKRSRGLAYFTAVNIDGKNYVKIPRGKDNWVFDPRIEEKYQYGHEVYAANDLDKGHLVRRMDPNWGEHAQQANDDTFHYTNSAPQHKNLNQKIWLELEDYILQNARAENLRVTIFSGPVFRDDDLIYRKKYQIPAEFWKVAVIVKEDGKLSATAYLQTQKNMIDNLEFAYGAYKTYQVPVATIEKITGLDFADLSKFDPIAAIEATGIVITDPGNIKF